MDLQSRILSCVECRQTKKAKLEASNKIAELKPEIVIREKPSYLVIMDGNGTQVQEDAAGWLLDALFKRFKISQNEVQICPTVWCTDVKPAVPSSRNCRPLIYDKIDKKNLKGIILLGRDAVRFFLGRGAAPPQPESIHGRAVRVHDVPYPIFLMPNLEMLKKFDPASQSLKNKKSDVLTRLKEFLKK